MGRYYSGDVEGKFWFAVQPSNVHERFGAIELSPSFIEYQIENTPQILNELEKIESEMGPYLEALYQFFEEALTYNSDDVEYYLKMIGLNSNADIANKMIREYADWETGIELLDYFKKNENAGHIFISAEV
tara:strand:+ start:396 stop:788 length:393 start_codon:yes stop_codon:yes gene_type:complete